MPGPDCSSVSAMNTEQSGGQEGEIKLREATVSTEQADMSTLSVSV